MPKTTDPVPFVTLQNKASAALRRALRRPGATVDNLCERLGLSDPRTFAMWSLQGPPTEERCRLVLSVLDSSD